MNLSEKKKNSMKNIWLGDQLLLKILIFKIPYLLKLCPILFIILVSLTMTRFSEKMLISTRFIHGFMSNLIKKSWTDSNLKDFPPWHQPIFELDCAHETPIFDPELRHSHKRQRLWHFHIGLLKRYKMYDFKIGYNDKSD